MAVKRLARQFGKYGGVAAGSALIDWLIFLVVNALSGNPIAAQMVSRIAGGLFSFAVNRSWTFDNVGGRGLTVEGRRFLLLYFVSYWLSISILYAGVYLLGLSEYPTKLVADSTCFVLNFLVMRSYVFHGRPGVTERLSKRLTRPHKSSQPDSGRLEIGKKL